MKWPFVSRAKYEETVREMTATEEALLRELNAWETREAERRTELAVRAAARRAQRAAKRVTIDAADATADTATDAAEPRKPDPVAQAIRQVAGLDRALARHLRAFAEEARARDMNERDIVKAIRTGQEVRV